MSIIVNNVSIKYGNTNIISQLSAKISPGECIWVQGNNGSGKTTFLKFLSGMDISKSGYVNTIGKYNFFLCLRKLPLTKIYLLKNT